MKARTSVPVEELERLLLDSRESTIDELDELSFIRLALACLSRGMTYPEVLECTHQQLSDAINGE